MSGQFVTDSGFAKPTLPEIKESLERDLQEVFGVGADFDPAGALGNQSALLSRREALFWDGLEEVYLSRNPASATGVSLDNLASQRGLQRLPATPTKCEDVILYGTAGTVVPAGSRARLKEYPEQAYSLDASVTISADTFAEVQLDPSVGTGTYSIVLDGAAHTATVALSATKEATIDAMVLSLAASTRWDAARITGPKLRIRPKIAQAPGLLGTLLGYSLVTLGSFGDFTGILSGELACPTEALNEIATPVSGWTGVYNRVPGQIGGSAELDESLRIRLGNSSRAGKATEEAIVQGLYDDVEGLTQASCSSNRTMLTVNGTPPKSFSVVAVGGTDLAIAQSIWRTQPAGIESFGNVVDTRDGLLGIKVLDKFGYPQRVFFSRPVAVYIWVLAHVRLSTEEAAPLGWESEIKSAILALAGAELQPGKDVVHQNLFRAIFEVPGISFVDLWIGKSSDPLAVAPDAWQQPAFTGGVWDGDKLPIAPIEYADFSATRISVDSL